MEELSKTKNKNVVSNSLHSLGSTAAWPYIHHRNTKLMSLLCLEIEYLTEASISKLKTCTFKVLTHKMSFLIICMIVFSSYTAFRKAQMDTQA